MIRHGTLVAASLLLTISTISPASVDIEMKPRPIDENDFSEYIQYKGGFMNALRKLVLVACFISSAAGFAEEKQETTTSQTLFTNVNVFNGTDNNDPARQQWTRH